MDPNGSSALRRVLGPMSATCVVIGAIVGVGIFFTPSRVAMLAGSGTMALSAWGIGGAIALCGALTFADLGARYPHAGGQYEILRDAYGPFPAFLFVFCNATGTQASAIAIIALLCTQNLVIAVGAAALSPAWLVTLSCMLIVCVTAANVMGVRWGSSIQNVSVAAKLGAILVIAGLAVWATTNGATPTPPASAGSPQGGSIMLLFAATVPMLFSYGGWQHALWIAGEVRDPRRNVPLAIIIGVVIVVFIYVLANWSFLQLLGYDAVCNSKALAADAVARVWPTIGKRLAAGAVAISAFGVLNAQLLSGPRLIYRMATDGRFFSIFGRVAPRRATPAAAILLLGVVGLSWLLLAAVFSKDAAAAIDKLTTGAVSIDSVFFVLTGVSLFVLRRRRVVATESSASAREDGADGASPASAGAAPMRLGYPYVPAAFVVGELGIILGAYAAPDTRAAALIGLAWIVAAGVFYASLFQDRRPRVPQA